MGGRLFCLGVVTALALCNHSLTLIYVDCVDSKTSRNKRKLLTNKQLLSSTLQVLLISLGGRTIIIAVAARASVRLYYKVPVKLSPDTMAPTN
jgi:hypothetical protein